LEQRSELRSPLNPKEGACLARFDLQRPSEKLLRHVVKRKVAAYGKSFAKQRKRFLVRRRVALQFVTSR
jgi:hypothetical protein